MSNLKEKMDGYEKQFKQLNDKLKEVIDKQQELANFRQQVWDEMNVVKGRFNELKEILDSGKVSESAAVDASGNGDKKEEGGRILEATNRIGK